MPIRQIGIARNVDVFKMERDVGLYSSGHP
jgi:hypothetical protein